MSRSHWTVRAHELRQAQARQLAQTLSDIHPDDLEQKANDAKVYRATAGGDERRLRGIPAIGRSVTGAIPGTTPHADR